MDLLRSVNKEGKTLIVVTHDTGIARTAKKRIHILDGRIEE